MPNMRVVLRYGPGNAWREGQPAAVTRSPGRDTVSYLGALLDPKLTAAFAQASLAAAGVRPGVSVSRRVGAGREVYVLTNFSPVPQEVALPGPMADVLAGGSVTRVAAALRRCGAEPGAALTHRGVAGASR